MTIVPQEILKNDPQHLLFHYPEIHPVRYTQLHADYHFWRAVDAAEKTAAMFERYLVPASCLHWERRSKFAHKRVQVGRKTFYALARDEMTRREFEKYLEQVSESMEVCHA